MPVSRKAAISGHQISTVVASVRKALDAQRADKVDTAFGYLDLLFGGQFPGARQLNTSPGTSRIYIECNLIRFRGAIEECACECQLMAADTQLTW
jgi:hypothetical protein